MTVSPYLLRPLRDHQTAQLEGLVRRSWAEGWARGQDAQTITKDVSQAALSAFPDISPTTVSVTIRQLLGQDHGQVDSDGAGQG
jgi:hypothetical protein